MALQESGRVIVYPNQVPYDTDVLRSNLYLMTATDALSATTLGIGVNYPTMVRGFPCVPISPPGLSVIVGSNQTPDIIYTLTTLDATPYGSLPADTVSSHQQYKQGFNWGQVTLSTPAPVTTGNSVIHLVQVAFSTQDANNVSRPYFNSTNPTMPIFNNNFDTRTDLAVVEIKHGVEAPSPVAPTPDPGFIGLWYVEVAFGQTSIVSGNITKVSTVEGQPFITESLTQKVSEATIASGFVSINNWQLLENTYATDVGTTNNVVLNPGPPYTAYQGPSGHGFITGAVENTNTGPATLNVSSLGAINIYKQTAAGYALLSGGEMFATHFYQFILSTGAALLLNPEPVDTPTLANLQAGDPIFYLDTGTTDALVITGVPPYTSYAAGTIFNILVANTNIGAVTLNANGLGAINVQRMSPTGLINLISTNIRAGGIYTMISDGTQLQLLNPTLS